MPIAESLKEIIRPYYLRWIYFPLNPRSRPSGFSGAWRYPYRKLVAGESLEIVPGAGPDILFYPMTDWHTRPQRSQHLARAFTRLGHRSISVNPHLGRQFETVRLFDRAHRLSFLDDGLFEFHLRLPREPVYHHRLLRPEEDRFAEAVLGRLVSALGTQSAIQIVSLPIWLEVASSLRSSRGYPIVYDCHDLLAGFSNVAPEVIAAEAEMFRRADLVLFSAQALLDHHAQSYPELRAKSRLLRNAVDFAHFQVPKQPHNRPVAGYVGAIDAWFDAAALAEAARANPDLQFVLAGRVENPAIRELRLPNVELLGEVAYEQLPPLFARFDVGLIPFLCNELTMSTNPIKLYEYFSCGLPVVSAPLPEVAAFDDLVYLASNPAGFAAQVRAAICENDAQRRDRRRRIAESESWSARANQIAAEFPRLFS